MRFANFQVYSQQIKSSCRGQRFQHAHFDRIKVCRQYRRCFYVNNIFRQVVIMLVGGWDNNPGTVSMAQRVDTRRCYGVAPQLTAVLAHKCTRYIFMVSNKLVFSFGTLFSSRLNNLMKTLPEFRLRVLFNTNKTAIISING